MSKSLKMIIEALLFSSDKPLTVKEINDVLPDAEKSEIRNTLKILTHDYDALERSFVLKEVAGGFQFRSRPEYGSYILRMFQKTPNRLSRATIETLAIIAYKQPILRSEIERLRGVDVGGILKTLMEKGLIKIMGRKELPGRPLIYGTTKRFLEVFDLKDLNSLPKLKEIKDFAADQYEPTTVNTEDSDEERDGEEDSTEDTWVPSNDHVEETAENGLSNDDEQIETDEAEADENPEKHDTEAEVNAEDSEIPEPQGGINEEDDSVKTADAVAPEEKVEPEENGTKD